MSKLKLRLFYALILSIAIYVAETWVLPEESIRVLQVFQNNCLRPIPNINYLAGYPSIKYTNWLILNRKLAWFGHMCWLADETLVKRSLKKDFKIKRRRSRPPTRWTDVIKEEASLPGSTDKNMQKTVSNGKKL